MRLRTIALAVGCALGAVGAPGAARAGEINTGNPDVELRWDNTVRYNLGTRINQRNQSGIGNNPAFDEGEFSFKRGDIVTNRLDVMSEMDVVFKKKAGFRVSAALWYDHAYSDGVVHRNPAISTAAQRVGSSINDTFSHYTERYYQGPSAELMDAFAFASFDIGDMPLSVKAGRHTVFWGESLLLSGSLHGVSYSQMPIDLAKGFATPGADAKELFRPLTNISGQLQVSNELSLAAQYFFDWESFRYPESGTFLGPADFAFNGAHQVQSAAGILPNFGAKQPSKRGDFGLHARWSPAALDGTVGFYYRNYTDKLLGLSIASGAPVTTANPLGLQYGQFYGEDIDLFGVSLAKNIGGVSIGTELSYRHNTTLNAQTLGFTPGALKGSLAALAPALFPHGVANTTLIGNSYQARGNTWHFVANALGVMAGNAVFDTASYAAELTYSRLGKVTANQDMYFGEGYGVCHERAKAVNQYKDKWDGCSTKDALGLAVNFTPTWFQVLPGVDLAMPFSISRTLSGNSPVALGGNQGNGNYSIGFSADVQQKYKIDLKYVDFFGHVKTGVVGGLPAVSAVNGLSTLLKDRGHLVLTLKTTF